MQRVLKFFDKLEDRVRGRLSRVPIAYAIIGAIAIVLFWRGVWYLGDLLQNLGGLWSFVFHPLISLGLSILVLLGTGLFVSFFIGDRIILSGLTHEKKLEEKTEIEVREEEAVLQSINAKLIRLQKEFEEIKSRIAK